MNLKSFTFFYNLSSELTRELQVECIRTIFILISSQLYEECITEKCEFIRYLFKM